MKSLASHLVNQLWSLAIAVVGTATAIEGLRHGATFVPAFTAVVAAGTTVNLTLDARRYHDDAEKRRAGAIR